MKKAQIGSISHATLRSSDLLDAFYDCLKAHVEGDEYKEIIEECQNILSKYSEDEINYPQTDSEAMRISELVNEDLPNALQEAAPPYCYFGNTEGDGSDFGFWPCQERMEYDDFVSVDGSMKHNDINYKVADLSQLPTGYVLHMNDHGNMTLYSYELKLKEEWSIV